ncbi:MAG TPA: cytochrome c [Gemmatimonadales bacterium]|jgi:cytochrome c553
MLRSLRWLRLGCLSGTVLLVVGSLSIYLLSERIRRRTYAEPVVAIVVPGDSQSIVEGQRLAAVRGCSGGCHGTEIEGGVLIDDPLLARVIAPNLTAAVRRYSDGDLARIIRQGVRPDGHSVLGMPSEMFSALSDGDLGKILAYLKSIPPRSGLGPEVHLGPVARVGLVTGKYHPAAEQVRRARRLSESYPGPGDSTAPGAYLARTSCTECHGVDLRGGDRAPDLRIAAGYSLDAFTRLMRQGKALGDRELPMMSPVARQRFSHFTDEELRALYRYLIARAGMPDSSPIRR